jgi:spermidine synthase
VIPWKLVDRAETKDTGELRLYQRGAEFSIRIDGREVMNSRLHSSEDALAEIPCAQIADRAQPTVLVGGLGMGFTLAAALRQLGTAARVVVAELIPAVVSWNQGVLRELAGNPLDDPRVSVRVEDVARSIEAARGEFDAVLLDVDNSPDSLIQQQNRWLYTKAGLSAIRASLRPGGVLGVWSVGPDAGFSRRVRAAGFEVDTRPVRARGRRGGARHRVTVARPRKAEGRQR